MILSIQNLSTKFEPHLQDVSFDVKEGEIFGLYGLVGAGRTELLETIFGVRTRAAGRVYFNNRLMNFSSAKEAMEHGFAMITEERKANGLFLKGDLTFNTTIANLQQYMSVSYTHLNGLGMTREQVKRLFGDTDHMPSGRGSGIGVKNVHQRIRLYFGNDYGLEIQSEPDEGTTVTAHLPAIPYEEVKKEGSYVK